MYIKQIVINGFRSYKEKIIVDDFSPHHNVVVGRNGSGKSNFFHAIQFALSADEFGTLQQQQRLALVYEGAGAKLINASVELIFDNSDNRLPIDKDEVSVKRDVGSKKDQYYLDGKPVTKGDILSLLESAGFSKSNPYYIVKQGQINQLATAKAKDRLELLKEVAGTSVYDDRKKESQKIMDETLQKKAKIEEILACIEERLSKLEREKEELREFHKWDKKRRAVEYTIHNIELAEVSKKLDQIKDQRGTTGQRQHEMQVKRQEALDIIAKTEKEIHQVNTNLQCVMSELETIQQECEASEQTKAQLELKLSDLKEESSVQNKAKHDFMTELKEIENRITSAEKDLEAVKPRFQNELSMEQEAERNLSLVEQRRGELLAKQGRGAQFKSAFERDAWLEKESKQLTSVISDKQRAIDSVKSELHKDGQELQKLSREIADLEGRVTQQKGSTGTDREQLTGVRLERENLVSQRSELWRRDAVLQQELAGLKDEQTRSQHMLRGLAGKGTVNGIQSIQKVLAMLKEKGTHPNVVSGYHGLLIENFTCPRHLNTAVEVTGGGKLFNHIVEDDIVATRILMEMNNSKLPGEVTFLPINRLKPKKFNYPEVTGCSPLVSDLTYDRKLSSVFEFAFGRALLCRDLDIATDLAKPSGLDCVTLEGDQVVHTGTLFGGYHDSRKSKMELQSNLSEINKRLTAKQVEYDVNKEEIARVDEALANHTAELQRVETKLGRGDDIRESLTRQLDLKLQQQRFVSQGKHDREKSLSNLTSSLDQLTAQRQAYQNEIGTALVSQLSQSEQSELESLAAKISDLQEAKKLHASERIRLESEKNRLESLLQRNLIKRKREIQTKLDESTSADFGLSIRTTEQELSAVRARTSKASASIQTFHEEMANLKKALARSQTKLDDDKAEERRWAEALEDDAKTLEKHTNKYSILMKKQLELNTKMRELGTIPSDTGEKFSSKPLKSLYKMLDEANKELAKFGHVNRKALEQYVSFGEYKDKLVGRRQELDTAQASITDLLGVLDQRKFDAIQHTFKNVAFNFAANFKKLVPQGRGELMMKVNPNPISETSQSSQGSSASSIPVVEQFTGIDIAVSFASNAEGGESAEMRDLNQLSGGQKSLVALTLIFAIQQCDPAPFYLFDEIDQALDPIHRGAVAAMIRENARDAQFITTTFRPELLEHADKYFGVTFANKESQVIHATKEQAFDFVEDDAQQK